MDVVVTETPPRKRPRSQTPSSSSSHHVNKRFRPETLSPSPRAIRFDPVNTEEDQILESDTPESPIAASKGTTTLSVSFAPRTPMTEINGPFEKLKVSSAQKKTLATPVALKSNPEGSKSVKKSARKTPGSAKSNKALQFRIKVFRSQLLLNIVFNHVLDRSSFDCDSYGYFSSSVSSNLLACGFDTKNILDATKGYYSIVVEGLSYDCQS